MLRSGGTGAGRLEAGRPAACDVAGRPAAWDRVVAKALESKFLVYDDRMPDQAMVMVFANNLGREGWVISEPSVVDSFVESVSWWGSESSGSVENEFGVCVVHAGRPETRCDAGLWGGRNATRLH